jgi:hypothetical protein
MAHPPIHSRRRPAGLKRGALVLGLALLAGACDDLGPTAGVRPGDAVELIGVAPQTFLVGFRSAPGTAGTALIQGLGGTVVHQYRYIPVVAASLLRDARFH